ncbi:PREDICTED: uncharacterized protein LOC109218756 [Nicotiana attenuata]|uniref:uncharacterized protein LOC109218756 n=1 Tax=Nicotiana attenuata TaxID=49451 RepID=UPI000905BE8E|nr:PREDICTED: uncharacterized protein LOC109218756 [Nicotiana attenuata]
MAKILHNGPWFINGHFLSVQQWIPNFVATKACQNHTAVWIRLPQLPTKFYDGIILTKIGNYIGKLLKVDACTSATLRGRYARLCVELPLNKPVQTSILIGQHVQPIPYEGEGRISEEVAVPESEDTQEWKIVSFPKKGKNKVANPQQLKEAYPNDKGKNAHLLASRPGKSHSPGTSLTNLATQLDSTSNLATASSHSASQSAKGKDTSSDTQIPIGKPHYMGNGGFPNKPHENIVLENNADKKTENENTILHGTKAIVSTSGHYVSKEDLTHYESNPLAIKMDKQLTSPLMNFLKQNNITTSITSQPRILHNQSSDGNINQQTNNLETPSTNNNSSMQHMEVEQCQVATTISMQDPVEVDINYTQKISQTTTPDHIITNPATHIVTSPL